VSSCAANCIPLLIHQNLDGTIFFNRSWAEFKVGFNDSRGNYWLGNDLLHQLTNEARYKLRCVVQARSNNVVYVASYGTFLVGSESSNYTLRVADYSGNAGDSMSYHNGMMFSTYDRDNDVRRNSPALSSLDRRWFLVQRLLQSRCDCGNRSSRRLQLVRSAINRRQTTKVC